MISAVEPVEENVRGHQNFIPRSLPRLEDNFLPYGTTAAEPTLSPSIDTTNTPINVTVIKGKAATLACVVRNIGNEAVRVLFIYYHLTGFVIVCYFSSKHFPQEILKPATLRLTSVHHGYKEQVFHSVLSCVVQNIGNETIRNVFRVYNECVCRNVLPVFSSLSVV